MDKKFSQILCSFFILLCFIFLIQNISYTYPSNAMVKVAIMDSKYTTVEKSEIVLYATSDMIVSDLKTKEELGIIPKGAELKINRSDGKYTLYYIEPLTEMEYEAVFDKDISITVPNGVIGIKDLIRGGKPALYRGEFRIVAVPDKSDKFYLINCLDVEYYLKGVVPCEMPVSFGLEALKAQAVAARVYSLTPRTKISRCYDVVDSVASQVYNGYNRESELSNRAIDETHGIVALYNDDMIVAVFCSTAGGYTENYSETFSDPITQQFPAPVKGYLVAKPDLPDFKPLNNEDDALKFYSSKPLSYDIHSPLYRWTRTWTKDELERVLKSTLIVQSKTGFVEPKLTNPDDFGSLKEIKVTKRGDSGKIVFMEISTDKNTFTVGKELVIRRIFQKENKPLPSANVVFTYTKDDNGNLTDIVAYGGGFGHGCGLSQYGAMYMAKDCKMSFDTILKHYYNNICLGTKPVEIKNTQIPQCFFAPSQKAILVIPDKGIVNSLCMKINNEDVTFNLENKNTKQRCEIDISNYIIPNELNLVVFYPPVYKVTTHKKHHQSQLGQQSKSLKAYIKLL